MIVLPDAEDRTIVS